MKHLTKIAALALVLLAAPVAGQDMGVSAGHDLDALLATARQTWDLAREDAVILLNDRSETLAADGTLTTRVHQVVWIATDLAIETYADLRLPWNSGTTDLKVEILRTWCGGRWWPDPALISETAVVPTLPFALQHADDYTTQRETMLLHDGIELPCIIETAYTLTERGLPAADGRFIFPLRDPAVRVQLRVAVPADAPWHAAELNGAAGGVESTAAGLRTTLWVLSPVAPLKQPAATEPAAYEPAVCWSTWASWDALAATFLAEFDAAARCPEALVDTVQARTLAAPDRLAAVRAVLDYVDEAVGAVDYDAGFWRLAPRPAARIWATGYGHDLDRCVLAAGALRALAVAPAGGGSADLQVQPVRLGAGAAVVAPQVPRLAGLGTLALLIDLPGTALLWSPAAGLQGQAAAWGRPLTSFAPAGPPRLAGPVTDDRLGLHLVLEPAADGGWSGKGALRASGRFSPQADLLGGGQTLAEAGGAIVAPVLAGLALDECSPVILGPDLVDLAFAAALPAPADDTDRARLVVGAPGGGLLSRLPADVRLWQAARQSPAQVPALAQDIELKIRLGDAGILHLPAPRELANDAGRFVVEAAATDGWLRYRRRLELTGRGDWPQLRALLLEEGDPLNATIFLDPKEEP